MIKKASIAVFLVIILAFSAAILLLAANQWQTPNAPTKYTYQITKTFPHDTTAYTEGLIFNGGEIYESTGEYGTSYLRRTDLQSGRVLQQYNLTGDLYGEGLTQVDGTLVQLTWLNNIGFIYDKQTFALLDNFSVSTEGWGLTYNGNQLIMSDGTSKLHFLDPGTHAVTGQVTVKDGDTEITKINELEYVKGDIYANIWQTTKIAIINPQTGQVKGWIDLSGLYQSQGVNDVLNGIAYDAQTGRLFVTGKNWPNLYEIELVPKS